MGPTRSGSRLMGPRAVVPCKKDERGGGGKREYVPFQGILSQGIDGPLELEELRWGTAESGESPSKGTHVFAPRILGKLIPLSRVVRLRR